MKVDGINQAMQMEYNTPKNSSLGEKQGNFVKVSDEKVFEAQQYNIGEKDVIKAVENANKALIIHNTQLEFSIHEKTKEIMVKVIDQETKKIIREIPPEKILDMVAKLWELAGILVDERR